MSKSADQPPYNDFTDDVSSIAPSYRSSATTATTASQATLQPPTYADEEIMTVLIPGADLADSDDEGEANQPAPSSARRGSWLAKLKPKKKPNDQFLMMTRGDYMRYWARDKNGKYIGTEPEGQGRRMWRVKNKLELERGFTGIGAPDQKSKKVEMQFGRVMGTIREPGNQAHLYGGPTAGPTYKISQPGLTHRDIERIREAKARKKSGA